MGCVHLYCGDGKGKTTAAIGLTVRMAGCGKQAVIARFLKNDQSGEVEALKRFPEITLIPCEKIFGFTWKMTPEVKREAAGYYKEMFEKACREAERLCTRAEASGGCKTLESELSDDGPAGTQRENSEKPLADSLNRGSREGNMNDTTCDILLVLDEIGASLSSGLLELSPLLAFLDHRPPNLEVVLTGRKPPQELVERADYITEMKKIRHPFDQKLPARQGIEY